MPVEKALLIIEENLDRQFDHALGTLFVEIGRKGELDHIVGHSDSGIPLQNCVMCGPTIAVKRAHVLGSHLYCPSCTGEYSVQKAGGLFQITPTGKTGAAEDLTPQVDKDVIADVVRASARALLA